MPSLNLIIVLFATVLVEIAVSEDDPQKIFEECAQANGLKPDPEMINKTEEARKAGEKTPPPPENTSHQEFLCTQKCFFEKSGLISNGEFVIDKVKTHKMMMRYIADDKIETFLKCLEAIEINECSDLKKAVECNEASRS